MRVSCPNLVQTVGDGGKSLAMTTLHNCVKDSYACHTGGSIFAGGHQACAVVGITCVVCMAICPRLIASLIIDQSIDKLY